MMKRVFDVILAHRFGLRVRFPPDVPVGGAVGTVLGSATQNAERAILE